jgi:UrcA family protein
MRPSPIAINREVNSMEISTRDRLLAGLIGGIAVMAVATLSVGGTSHAADMSGEERDEVRVRFGDLDLSKAEGVNVLRRRIQFAAESVCDQGALRTSLANMRVKECVKTAVSHALEQIGLPAYRQVQDNGGSDASER